MEFSAPVTHEPVPLVERMLQNVWMRYLKELGEVWRPEDGVELMPTACDVVAREGTARLLRFGGARRGTPVVLVPSLINQWYVLDLRKGASLVAALVEAGIDVWCLDWGAPEDEDRYRGWDDVIARLGRMVRRVRREAGSEQVGMLGYCMGGTLAAIYSALEPTHVKALVNLAGPIDFAKGGALARMVDRRWFDADAVADAGNVSAEQMQAGFAALRPTLEIAKWVGRPESKKERDAVRALEMWAGDNIAFPGEAYRTYIGDLYQGNRLVKGTHRVMGRAVDLGAITCPVMAIVAEKDQICPAEAATALLERVGGRDVTTLRVPGGHVGAVVGSRAAKEMYPAVAGWLTSRLEGGALAH